MHWPPFEICKITLLYINSNFFEEMRHKIAARAAVLAVLALLMISAMTPALVRGDDGEHRDTTVSFPGGGYFSIDSQSTNSAGPRNEYAVMFAGNSLIMSFKNNSQETGYNLQFGLSLVNLTYAGPAGNAQLLNFGEEGFSMKGAPSYLNGSELFAIQSESDTAKFTMFVQVTDRPQEVSLPQIQGSTLLMPYEVKISFFIVLEKYFREDTAATGNVILNIAVQTDAAVAASFGKGTDSFLNFSENGYTGYFSWSNNALVDGREGKVVSAMNGTLLSLTYPAGNTIIHDPSIGITPQTLSRALASALAPAGNIVIYAMALTVAVLLVAGAAYRRRR